MSTGANNQSGETVYVFNRPGFLAQSAFFEGAVACYSSNASADNLDCVLPSSADAALSGRAFAGIWTNAGTAVVGKDHAGVAKLGIAKAQLKANTACTRGGIAAYDPADGGYVVPYTSSKQVKIGRFTQSKPSQTYPQFVGVELASGIGEGSEQLLGAIVANSSVITNTTAETAFDQVVTLPANYLAVGQALKIRAKANVLSGNGTDTLTLKVRLGGVAGVILGTSAAVDVTNGGGDLGVMDLTATIRSLGATGTLTAQGTASLGVPGTATARVTGTAGTVTIDTTTSKALVVTATWSAADAANQVRLEDLVVSVIG